MLFIALGSFSTVFGEEWKEQTDRDFVKVISKFLIHNYFLEYMYKSSYSKIVCLQTICKIRPVEEKEKYKLKILK